MLKDSLFYLMENFKLFSLLLHSFSKYLSTPFSVLDAVLSVEYN